MPHLVGVELLARIGLGLDLLHVAHALAQVPQPFLKHCDDWGLHLGLRRAILLGRRHFCSHHALLQAAAKGRLGKIDREAAKPRLAFTVPALPSTACVWAATPIAAPESWITLIIRPLSLQRQPQPKYLDCRQLDRPATKPQQPLAFRRQQLQPCCP
jgi:hypothetical protein